MGPRQAVCNRVVIGAEGYQVILRLDGATITYRNDVMGAQ